MTDDTTRGVHLNEKQLVFVLMAAGVICCVAFLFGVLVGRGVQNERGAVAGGAMSGAPEVAPDPQPAAEAAGARPAGSPPDDFSYPKRLSQPDAPVEPLRAPTPATGGANVVDGPVSPPDVPDDSLAAGRTEPAEAGPFSIQVKAAKSRGDADVIAKRLKAQGYDVRVVAPAAGDRTGVFRVKVGLYKTRRDADVVARKLESEGKYKPWVTR
ncbi:MAG: SPOR domain-containing protein [Acidobacteria bacterium]|nr:SPOR domain-containing protein [Acidobacteriota bacterium]